MSNETVLPCPFCWHEPELILRGNAFTKKRNAEIKCHNCGAEIVVGTIRNNLEWCKDKVIEKWNKREAREKVIGELVEWMEEQHEFLKGVNVGINDKHTQGRVRQIVYCITHAKSLLKQEGAEKTYGEKLIDAIEKLERMGLWEEWKEENPSRVNALKKLINS